MHAYKNIYLHFPLPWSQCCHLYNAPPSPPLPQSNAACGDGGGRRAEVRGERREKRGGEEGEEKR